MRDPEVLRDAARARRPCEGTLSEGGQARADPRPVATRVGRAGRFSAGPSLVRIEFDPSPTQAADTDMICQNADVTVGLETRRTGRNLV